MSMTARQQTEILNYFVFDEGTGDRVARWKVAPNVAVDVRIIDLRRVFGRLDVLVQPRAGVGMRWVEATKVLPTRDEFVDAWLEAVR